MNNIFTLIFLSMIILSCKKSGPVADNDQPDASGVVKVLKDDSGFLQVYTASGAEIDLTDFTVEANDNLNIVHYTLTRTQQDNFKIFTRETKNLNTGEIVPLPQYAFDVSGYSPNAIRGYQKLTEIVLEAFKPYSNYFVYGTYMRGNFTYNYSVTLGGDMSAEVKHANPLGSPDLGYYYPSLDVEIGHSYYTVGVPNPSYLYQVVNLYQGQFNNGTDKMLIKTLLESRISTNNNGSSMQFDVSKNGVVSYKTDIADVYSKDKTGEITFSNLLPNVQISRHYSSDGKILVLLIKDANQHQYWAVSYNFSTNTLTKLFDKTTLDYGGEGSDVDCDENGYLYYTGIADNGKNALGVSIYKKDKQGVTTLLGTDAFLKFGEIVKLKRLHGKVYLAVRGKITGSPNWQLCIVKQS